MGRVALGTDAIKKIWASSHNRTGLKASSLSQGGTGLLSYTPRILLFPLLVIVQLAASFFGGAGFLISNPPLFMLTGTFLWLVWFAGLFVIAPRSSDGWLAKTTRWLRPVSLAAFITLMLVLVAEVSIFQTGLWSKSSSVLVNGLHRVFVYNDGTALSQQAASHFLEGKDPYSNANIVTAMEEFNGGPDKVTPRREGTLANSFPYPTTAELNAVWQRALADPSHPPPEFESRLNYPAGIFELPAPFIKLGIPDIRWVFLIYVLAGMLTVVLLAPKKYRLPLAGMMLVSVAIWNAIASGETGSLAFPFMLVGWVTARKYPWVSAVLMGIAVTTKQTAWFLAPFYAILLFRTFGMKKTLYLGGIVAAVFLASNALFIVRAPVSWMNSLGAPMSTEFFPLGVGLITLVTSGIVVIKSSLVFSAIEIVVFLAAIVWYFRNCERFPHTGPVLAIVPLFFAWRSLWPYFFYMDVIVLSAVIIDEYGWRMTKTRPARVTAMKGLSGGQDFRQGHDSETAPS